MKKRILVMLSLIIIMLFLNACSETATDTIQFIKFEMFDGKVTADIPKALELMSDDRIKELYTNKSEMPRYVFINDDETVSIAFTKTEIETNPEMLELLHNVSYIHLQKSDEIEDVIDEGFEEINGNNVGTLKYINNDDTKVYCMRVHGILENKVFKVVYKYSEGHSEEWSEIEAVLRESLSIYAKEIGNL